MPVAHHDEMQTPFDDERTYRRRGEQRLLALLVVGAAASLPACSADDPSAAAPEVASPAAVTAPYEPLPRVCSTVADIVADRPSEALTQVDDLSPVAGEWSGSIAERIEYRGYRQTLAELPIGVVSLHVDAAGSSTIAFDVGAADAGALPTPNTADDPFLCRGSTSVGCRQTAEVMPGFAYTLGRASFDDGESPRFGFDLWRSEPWEPWCQLQTPRRILGECFAPGDACLGPPACDTFEVGPEPSRVDLAECRVAEGDGSTAVACDWLAAVADAPCACAEGGCVAQGGALTFSFSLSDDGQWLQGTVRGVSPSVFELQRVP